MYVESNFVLELALQQEQSGAAQLLLERAIRGNIALAMPSIALTEPFSTLVQRGRNLSREINLLSHRAKDLARNVNYQAEVRDLAAVQSHLESVSVREAVRLSETVATLLDIARIIPLDSAVFSAARAIQPEFNLGTADAIVLASVIHDLAQHTGAVPHFFVNRNTRDFNSPRILTTLLRYDCVYFGSFNDANLALSPY
jgi:predicted nucleic acid-binding protein